MSQITANPDPPVKGQNCTFCIDPPDDGTITITFNPGDQTQHPVTSSAPCVAVLVPQDAISCEASAPGSTAYTSPCAEP